MKLLSSVFPRKPKRRAKLHLINQRNSSPILKIPKSARKARKSSSMNI
jgi:hypothetical protein